MTPECIKIVEDFLNDEKYDNMSMEAMLYAAILTTDREEVAYVLEDSMFDSDFQIMEKMKNENISGL